MRPAGSNPGVIVTAHQGDTLDTLCWRHLGTTAPVEETLRNNPGLAARGPVLPEGQKVTLPEIAGSDTAARSTTIQLWD